MTEGSARSATRERIIEAAAALLRDGMPAVTTRGVAEAADVQAPVIYRLFGDKDGLLEAVTEHVLATYVAGKTEALRDAAGAEVDPVEDLRASWTVQIEFSLANPAVYQLLNDPQRAARSPSVQAGQRILEARVHRVAARGWLRTDERRAVDLIQAAGVGTVQTLLSRPVDQRDPGLAEVMFDAVLRQILVDAPPRSGGDTRAAVETFRALAPHLPGLTARERDLLVEWVDRAADEL
ncbi:TetR/AcrR family transcriptional regulator [Tersicoccus sp. MR15.9]|uniref:TetR/AcrR family transcriptional regulator n=1 Tax=Tersicoccus mangrovi TaxID=3121635 RepID=UPI002FE5D50F